MIIVNTQVQAMAMESGSAPNKLPRAILPPEDRMPHASVEE
jgi:hypothetical protein